MKTLVIDTNILAIGLLFFYTSCNSQVDNIDYSNMKEIIINADKQDNIAQNIIDFEYIKLQTNSKCLISNLDKVICKGNKIYILDSRAQSLFIFNMKGDFLFKIDKSGRGVGEYNYLMDFDVDEAGNIYCLDLSKNTVLKYDNIGRFIEMKKKNYFINNIAIVDTAILLTYQTTVINSNAKHKFVFYRDGKFINSYLPIDAGNSVRMLKPFHLINSKNGLLFNEDLSDTIYAVTPDSLYAKYFLNFGKYSISPKLRNDLNYFMNTNIQKMEGYRINNFFETSDYFTCTFNLSGKSWALYYCVKSEKTLQTYCPNCDGIPQKVINDFIPIGVYNDFFISYLKFHTIVAYKKELEENPERTRKLIGEDNVNLINSIDLNDNPVLVLYKMKNI